MDNERHEIDVVNGDRLSEIFSYIKDKFIEKSIDIRVEGSTLVIENASQFGTSEVIKMLEDLSARVSALENGSSGNSEIPKYKAIPYSLVLTGSQN